MKIGIYARGLSEESGGVKAYIENLIKVMINIIPEDTDLYIYHNLDKDYFRSKKNNIHEIITPIKSKIICDFIWAPLKINSLKLDVCLFPKDVIPFFINCKKIVTIHDLAHFLPKYNAYRFIDNVYMRFMINYSCETADRIIAVSNNTKKDINTILEQDIDRIATIYEASSISNHQDIDSSRIANKYCLPHKFIFYSGSISPRKNIIRLINAFEKLGTDIEHSLVITGNKMWKNRSEMIRIQNNNKIIVLGFVPQEDMAALYYLADIFVYPSLYEGFGLPILEAQALGCPVISSNVSSMPEVAGKGAILINPYKINEISNAIELIIKDKDLKRNLIRKGYSNVKKFSWEKCAIQTLNLFDEVHLSK